MDVRGVENYEVWRYVLSILDNPDESPEVQINMVLHTGFGDYVPTRIDRVVDKRDFASSFAQKFNIVTEFPLGEYYNVILVSKEAMFITLTIDDGKTPIDYKRFRAIPLVGGDVATESGDPGIENTEELNKQDSVSVVFEIGDIAHELARRTNYLSYPANCNLELAIKSLYAPTRWRQWDEPLTHKLPEPDDVYYKRYDGEIGVDLVPPKNKSIYDVVYIPKEITPAKLIPYLQESYGLWAEGAGRFHIDGFWYIYPIFNKQRYLIETETLTIINVPQRKLPEVERNYQVVDRNVFILANGEVKVENDGWLRTLMEGDGVRYLNANKVQDNFGIRRKGKLSFNKKDNLVARTVKQRGDNLNDFLPESTASRGNHYAAFSRLAHKRGNVINIRWRNGDPNLLRPGQPVGYFTSKKDTVEKLTGTLIGINTTYNNNHKGNLAEKIFERDTVLTIFVGLPD